MAKGLWPEKKKKNQWLSANKGSYAVNVLLGSQILPFSTALAWCPGVIYSAVIWWSLRHGRELNKNAIKEDKINLLTVLFNKNSWRMGRQTYKQCTSSARGWLGMLAQASGPGRGPAEGWLSEPPHPTSATGWVPATARPEDLPGWKRRKPADGRNLQARER